MSATDRNTTARTVARRRGISLAALAVALPAALLVRTRETLPDWWRRVHVTPIEVARGTTQPYAGARWALTDTTRLPGDRPGTVVMVVEFEATVDDPAMVRQAAPCRIALTDPLGRRWAPVLFAGSAARKAKPEVLARPPCGTFEKAARGQTVQMAASFFVPADAKDLSLAVTMMRALPDRLLLR